VQYLERNGIRPILNYAAEDDVSDGDGASPVAAAERKLDRNMNIFMQSIHNSDNVRNRAFVAIKVRSIPHAHAFLSAHQAAWAQLSLPACGLLAPAVVEPVLDGKFVCHSWHGRRHSPEEANGSGVSWKVNLRAMKA
jgi:hypothetical protein